MLKNIVDNNLNNPFYKAVMKMGDSIKIVQIVKQDFAREVIAKLKKNKLLNDTTIRLIDYYGMMKQGDWNKYMYDKEGKFIGNNKFEDVKFKDEAEYLYFKEKTFNSVESNPVLLESYQWCRKLLDDYYGKMQTAALLDNGATVGKVPNYWAMRSTIQNNNLEWKD